MAKTPIDAITATMDRTLGEHIERLLGKRYKTSALPTDLPALACLVLVAEREDEIEATPSDKPSRYTRDALLSDISALVPYPASQLKAALRVMIEEGYFGVDPHGGLLAEKPALAATQLLGHLFPKMPGLNLIAYMAQIADELLSGRKTLQSAARQVDEVLAMHGVALSSPATKARPDEERGGGVVSGQPHRGPKGRTDGRKGHPTHQAVGALRAELHPGPLRTPRRAAGQTPPAGPKLLSYAGQVVRVATGHQSAGEGEAWQAGEHPIDTGAEQGRPPREGRTRPAPQGGERHAVPAPPPSMHQEEASRPEDSAAKPANPEMPEQVALPRGAITPEGTSPLGEAVSAVQYGKALGGATGPGRPLAGAEAVHPAAGSALGVPGPDGQSPRQGRGSQDISQGPKETEGPPTGDAPSEQGRVAGIEDEVVANRIAAFENSLAMACPLCRSGKTRARQTIKGKVFYACSNKECSFISWGKPYHIGCPQCGSPFLVEATDQSGTVMLECPRGTCLFRQRPPGLAAANPSTDAAPATKVISGPLPVASKPRRRLVKRRVVRKKK